VATGREVPRALPGTEVLDPEALREYRAEIESLAAQLEEARGFPGIDPYLSRDPSALTVSDAVQLLDRAGFRLIRSADDHLDAVVEALREIGASAGQDLPMLYSAPDRQRGSARPNPRRHLEEDALQAYLRRTLLDELMRTAEGVEVHVVREDEVGDRAPRRERCRLRPNGLRLVA
jgi:hypothetical protein